MGLGHLEDPVDLLDDELGLLQVDVTGTSGTLATSGLAWSVVR
jgi:hypothetical protein